MLVLANRKDAVGNRQIFSSDDGDHAGQRQGFCYINALNQGMRFVTPQDFAEEHARQKDVIGKLRLARALRACIDLAEWFADYFEGLTVVAVVIHSPGISTDGHR